MAKKYLTKSRRSFLSYYILAIIMGFTLYHFYKSDTFSGFILYLLSFPFFCFLFIPEYEIISNKYYIKDENVENEEGIILKKRIIIPWRLVSQVSMKKNFLGRILNFGDILITTIESSNKGIIMRGIAHPEKILRQIEEKIGDKRVVF